MTSLVSYYDERSANMDRVTGWERYARSLRLALGDRVQGFGGSMDGRIRRLLADWSTVPLQGLRHSTDVRHFPTFPPSGPINLRTVWTIHDLTWWLHREISSRLGRRYYTLLANRALERCTIVTDTMSVRAEVINHFEIPEERVHVVYPGATNFAPAEPAKRQKPYILTVGTLEPRKNLTSLVDGFRASQLSKDYDLVIVGRVGWGSIPIGVTVLTGVNDSALSSLYAGASAFVLASLYEGFGLPLVEAVSYGLSIACSDIPVFREVVSACNGDAIYFDPTEVDSISNALSESVSQVVVQKSGGLVARTWDMAATEMLDLYSKLAHGNL
jgi:glycosyltransferase involved in cell wall biosynthesis